MRTARAFLAGIGLAYLFDRQQGRRRRRMLRDRAARSLRRAARFAEKRGRYTAGKAFGLAARLRQRIVPPARPVDDATVVQRIRSEALRDVGISTSEVDVDVTEGVATLRGSVPTRSLAEDLVDRIGKVPGVRHVEDRTTVGSGQPAD